MLGGLLLVLGGSAAFAPCVVTPGRTGQLHAKSQSLPFLEAPEKLDGSMIGDVGFDPLELSNIQTDLNYARTAELKHGRIAMLAVTGFFVQEYIHLPGADYQNSNPLEAISTVPTSANIQILLGCAVVELATLDKTYGDGEPGDLGWDPAFVLNGKSQEQIDDLKLKELSNGRLAMMAFLGQVVQTALFNKPLLEQW